MIKKMKKGIIIKISIKIFIISIALFSCIIPQSKNKSQLTNLIGEQVINNPAPNAVSWDLVWSDEFNYTGAPNPAKWSYEEGGWGWGNNELQYYTVDRRENAKVENGSLIITCRNEKWGSNNYTSAKLVTKNKGDWLYGKVEVKAKLPSGKGTWPAVWMMPTDSEYGEWPDSGELDIMEHVGFDQNMVHQTVHTAAYYHKIGTQKSGKKYIDGAATDFHIYSMEWFPDKVDFFIDGDLVFTFNNEYNSYREWPFDKRFYLILNIAFGGEWGGAQGVDPSVLPQTMEVDYVRVYKQGDPEPHIIPGIIEAEDYIFQNGIKLENCDEGGHNVGWIETGDSITYRVNVEQTGIYRAEYRVAGWGSGALILKTGDKILDSVTIPNTGAYQAWTTVRSDVTFLLDTGEYDIIIESTGSQWNINKFEIIKEDNPVKYNLSLSPEEKTSGAGIYDEDSVVSISYNGTDQFVRWTGDTATVNDVNSASTTVTMINDISLIAEVLTGVEVIKVEAENYDSQYGIDTEDCVEGGKNVGWIEPGDWMEYSVYTGGGTYIAEYRVAGWENGASFNFFVNNQLADTVNVTNTGAYQIWTSEIGEINIGSGNHTILIKAEGSGFNINWFKLTQIVSSSSSSSSISSSSSSLSSSSISISSSSSSSSSDLYTLINLPFVNDRNGVYKWKTQDNINYINSWNIKSLIINNVDISNIWISGSNLPSKQDGYYYIEYEGDVPWSHVEIK